MDLVRVIAKLPGWMVALGWLAVNAGWAVAAGIEGVSVPTALFLATAISLVWFIWPWALILVHSERHGWRIPVGDLTLAGVLTCGAIFYLAPLHFSGREPSLAEEMLVFLPFAFFLLFANKSSETGGLRPPKTSSLLNFLLILFLPAGAFILPKRLESLPVSPLS